MNNGKKTLIVTGGAQGLGLGIADHFVSLGVNVVVADADFEAGIECSERYSKEEGFMFIHTDVADEDSVISCVQGAINEFGRIDGLINNAAIANPERKPVTNLTLDEWNKVISVNLTGVFLMSKHCSYYLEKTRGSIVNIASTRAIQSEANTEAYSASKGGVVSLTHALAVSFSDRIRVNCISPGWIEVGDMQKKSKRTAPMHSHLDHKQHPSGRVGKPDDIAFLAAYLISDSSGFVTGQNFVVDGGMTKKMIYV